MVRMRTASLLIVPALLVAGCGGDGGDTTINQTTTVAEDPETTTSDREIPGPVQEFSGKCTGPQPLVPEQGKPGFADVRVAEGPCEFATQVATEFVSGYGPDCFNGCTKMVQGLRCETRGPAEAEVVCFAARTEVRFSIQGSD